MSGHPEHITIFDQTDRALHLAAAFAGGATIATGFAFRFHGPGPWGLGHGVAAAALTLVFVAHVTRVILAWLEKGGGLPLMLRPADFTDALRALSWGFGLGSPPPQLIRGYRQRLPYSTSFALFLLLLVTGVTAAFPGKSAGFLGVDLFLLMAETHAALGVLFTTALLAHVYFSTLSPGALWFNEALFTGERNFAGYAALHPDSAREFVEEEKLPAQEVEVGPGVEELLNEGNQAAKVGDFDKAAVVFARALELYPGYPQALFNLGACKYKLGEAGEAKRFLSLYLEQDAFGAASDRARAILAELGGEEKP